MVLLPGFLLIWSGCTNNMFQLVHAAGCRAGISSHYGPSGLKMLSKRLLKGEGRVNRIGKHELFLLTATL